MRWEHWRAAVKSGLQGGPHCLAQPILTRESGTSRISKQFILRADIFSSDSLQQLYPPTGPHRFPVTYILSKNYSEENCYRKKCWEIYPFLNRKQLFTALHWGFLLDWNVNNLTRIHHDLEASATLVNACLSRSPLCSLPSVKLSNR